MKNNTKARPQPGHGDLKVHSIVEAAGILGCSDMHVYRLVAAGEIQTLDIAVPGAGRTKMRIRAQDLAEYINRKAAPRRAAAGGE